MIELRLKDIAERLGKTISDIARETGLNRNTVTDLFHNKVDGIKFSTIDTLCETYGLTLQDLVARKEFRIGAAPTSRIVRQLRSTTPFASWLFLNALHTPSPRFFESGVGPVYAFFTRTETELYFDQREANRAARLMYERHRRNTFAEVQVAFSQVRDQLYAHLTSLSAQPLDQYVGPDLLKAFQRLSELTTDFLSLSAWADLFEFGLRDELVAQVQKAHSLSSSEVSILSASGEVTASITRRIATLKLAESAGTEPLSTFLKQREARRFFQDYPHIQLTSLTNDLAAYTAHPRLLEQEKNLLTNLSHDHVKLVKTILRAHNLRLNPLAFFAKLATLRDERDEFLQRIQFQFERILQIVAKRSVIQPDIAPYLLPQELQNAQNGLVTQRTLQHRHDSGFLLALEHGDYNVHEGEQAVSIQDDLASRYLSQLAYENLS